MFSTGRKLQSKERATQIEIQTFKSSNKFDLNSSTLKELGNIGFDNFQIQSFSMSSYSTAFELRL